MSTGAKSIRALIVDDEPLARRTIRDLLREDPEVNVVGECGGGREAVESIRRQPPDLLFLDIQMPGMDGFDVLSHVELERIPAIIFVTAYDAYALKAFEMHALDYLLKPFTDERFREALARAKSQVELRDVRSLADSLRGFLGGREPAGPESKGFLTRFMVKAGGRVIFVKSADVDWIEADNYYIKLHAGGKNHMLRLSMKELEESLDPKTFWRIHRSAIINLERVRELRQRPGGEYVAVLKDGTELKLSRRSRERLQELLTGDRD
ncbi:MAG TPA: LytTR family DNA-binding domain-containing protein [Pyrinomonadaceae bacterium]|jgi:two-component system LytT family response regulator|nr:LytTR family DNA-binding domain-containing protein [Pyrinomonadaceae bacterium]